jgi:hypothetical protein
MFADPITVTVGGSAKTLARTGTANDSGAFSSSDRAYKVTVAHAYARRTRRVMKLTFDSLVTNPLITGQNINQSASVSFVIDHPNGYDAATAKALGDALVAYLTASSGAAVTKLLGGES